MQISHSCEYQYSISALHDSWSDFVRIRREYREFIPRPIESYQDEKMDLFHHMTRLNPDKNSDEMMEFSEKQIQLRALPGNQYSAAFNNVIMSKFVSVVILSHAICESMVNAILAIGLSKAGKQDIFRLIEKSEINNKWLHGPTLISDKYKFPKSSALYETLRHLTRERNTIVHYKINLDINGVNVLQGKNLKKSTYNDQIVWIERFFSLPYDLLANYHLTTGEVETLAIFDRGPVEKYVPHLPDLP